ncbi:MAG: hypothetical protein IPJ14_15110 [Kineosporiaceae bacterium]|nr:hypothetical protein [Kineosporiaceae bacterium]
MSGAWFSQPFRPDGNITAEGLRNQLGRPALSMPTVLVRESAQNSWDARTSRPVIDFAITLGTMGPGQMSTWRGLLSQGMPVSGPEVFLLRRVLQQSSLRYLAISDRGTKGLGGPTRSDRPAPGGLRDWLSFVLNSGEARDTDGGGGTYGYGKGVFFLASQVGTVIIYTRIVEDDVLRTRLIGSALCSSFTARDVPYTGRHWWGLPQGDHCEPLRDGAADQVARALGLPLFQGQDTGTTVVVIEPNLLDPSVPEEEAVQLPAAEAGTFLADAMAWNLWPLALADRAQRMHQSVVVDDTPVPIPNEQTDPALAHLAAAYRQMTSATGEPVRCLRPRRQLGRFGHEQTMGVRITSKAAADLGLVEDLAVGEAPHHVCIMRTPELVVRYIPGRPKPHPELGYLGVLRVEDDLDAVFAKSEPPTHDAWIDSQLHGAEATYVRVTHRRIKEHCENIAGVRRLNPIADHRPVSDVARRLGHLLSGATGGVGAAASATAGSPSTGPGGFGAAFAGTGGHDGHRGARTGRSTPAAVGRAGGGPRPRLEGMPRFVDGPRGTILEQQVRLPSRGQYCATVAVVTGDGKLETDPFAGAAIPQIIGWRTVDEVTTGALFETDEPCDVVLLVDPVADATLEISVARTA